MNELLQQLMQLLGGLPNAENSVTVREWLKTWYDTYKAPYRKASTLYQIQTCLDRFILPAFGDEKLTALTGMRIQTLLNGITASNMREKVAGILRDSLNRAVKNRLILFNPFDSVEIPAHHSVHYRPLEFSEQNALLAEQNDRVKLSAMWVLLGTGMRIGEFLALDFADDVSLKTSEISIRKSINTHTGELTTPKTISLRV